VEAKITTFKLRGAEGFFAGVFFVFFCAVLPVIYMGVVVIKPFGSTGSFGK